MRLFSFDSKGIYGRKFYQKLNTLFACANGYDSLAHKHTYTKINLKNHMLNNLPIINE